MQRGIRMRGLPERQRGPPLGGIGPSGCRLRLVLGCFPRSFTGGELIESNVAVRTACTVVPEIASGSPSVVSMRARRASTEYRNATK